jgi:hypothetical protein
MILKRAFWTHPALVYGRIFAREGYASTLASAGRKLKKRINKL